MQFKSIAISCFHSRYVGQKCSDQKSRLVRISGSNFLGPNLRVQIFWSIRGDVRLRELPEFKISFSFDSPVLENTRITIIVEIIYTDIYNQYEY